jgi:hypothetical protein
VPSTGEPVTFDGRERFAAYVAHELRTPLATRLALLELPLADPNADVNTWREIGEDVLGAGMHQARLLEACLTLARTQSACNHLLVNGGRGPSPAWVRQARAQGLEFSQCERSQGVPNLPDPGSDGRIPDPASVGIDHGSPKFQAANQACRKYRPPYIPSNAGYNAYARTHGQ